MLLRFTSLNISFGGTSILIAVGVVLETYKQLESSVASRNYNRR
jgi:preprotein translocase subunit SecY